MKKKIKEFEIITNNFILTFPAECSRKTALKINKLLLEMEPDLVNANKKAHVQSSNIKNFYHIWNEPFHYNYYRGKLIKEKVEHCSMCGKILDMFDTQEDFVFNKFIGYGSWFDTFHLKFRLCADCMDKLLAVNIIPNLKSIETCEDYLHDTSVPLSLSELQEYAREVAKKYRTNGKTKK